jgi:hypothetical protein
MLSAGTQTGRFLEGFVLRVHDAKGTFWNVEYCERIEKYTRQLSKLHSTTGAQADADQAYSFDCSKLH